MGEELPELTQYERESIASALENAEIEHTEALSLAITSWGAEDLKLRFAPGSFGAHELVDRTNMLAETWEGFIVDHPTNALSPECHRFARMIVNLMHDYYQMVAIFDDSATHQEPDK